MNIEMCAESVTERKSVPAVTFAERGRVREKRKQPEKDGEEARGRS